MILDGLLTILQSLFGWLFLIILQMLLRIVDILERFFDIFAGTEPIYYQGEPNYLFDLFFSNSAITNLFWAMAIIAVILSFGFCIVAVSRKVTDVTGTTKHTLGQIISNFIRSLVVILLLNICIIAAINVTSVIFDRINFSLENAEVLEQGQERKYTDEEFATMTRILATMGNYAANPSAESRYNVNACFNAIRGEMITLFEAHCFDYDFPVVQTGKHTWQSALAQVAKAANLNEDLQLDTYYPTVQEAVTLCFDQLKTNSNFKPQETAVLSKGISGSMSTAKMIFLTSSMGAEENEQFINGGFEDALRRSYLNGEKDYLAFEDVYEDFAITKINYAIGLIAAGATILFMGKMILLFVVRMLNLLMLYVISPLFASSMSLDEGSRFQNWTQSFVMQLLAAYGAVVMMRVYLLILPIVISSEFQFFEPGSIANHYTIYGQLVVVLGGSWAVSRATTLISGALTGNASSALQEADSTFGRGISEAIGAGRLHKELSRFRMNKDRAKSYARGRFDKGLRPNGAEDESAKAVKELKDVISGSRDDARTNLVPEKQTHEDNGDNVALNRMRQSAGLDGNVGSRSYVDDGDREASKVSKMRSEMGFGTPAGSRRSFEESPDSFSLDSLPDLGKAKGNQGNNGDSVGTGSNQDGGNGKATQGIQSTSAPTGNRRRYSTGGNNSRTSVGNPTNRMSIGGTVNKNSTDGGGTTNKTVNKGTNPGGGTVNKGTNPSGGTVNKGTNPDGGNVNKGTNPGGGTVNGVNTGSVTGTTSNGETIHRDSTHRGTVTGGNTNRDTGAVGTPVNTGTRTVTGGNTNQDTGAVGTPVNTGTRTVTGGNTNRDTGAVGTQVNTGTRTVTGGNTNRDTGAVGTPVNTETRNVDRGNVGNTGSGTVNTTSNTGTTVNTGSRRSSVTDDRNAQMHNNLRERVHNRNNKQS